MSQQSTQSSPSDLLTHPVVRARIRWAARSLARRREFAREDVADVEGDIRVQVAIRLQRFDPERSSLESFVARAASCAAMTMLRDRGRQRRADGARTTSFEDLPSDASGARTCAESFTEEEAHRHRGRVLRDPIDGMLLRDSVAEVVSRLGPELHCAARALCEAVPFAAAAHLGISPRRMRRLIGELRDRFVECDLAQ